MSNLMNSLNFDKENDFMNEASSYKSEPAKTKKEDEVRLNVVISAAERQKLKFYTNENNISIRDFIVSIIDNLEIKKQ